ncbi:DUF4268 domain-containing protein [Thermococcus barophilus]|uniref:DUF4268 domain-containing protein n=1 Tax=Thermococcus barophilus (strain DSM 11836 / MP) TaxID=391623 RepID=F0LN46_THEBM|nr:DUF4268 domain-containing protein [Thermococcus barophilus]ADT84175.1 hypothetical protein TERMP_01199 [Thermococcus barophilus MP]
MSYVVIKNSSNIEIIEEENFSADKREEYLHKLIEGTPQIILKDIAERDVKTLASHLRLPSGGELDLLLVDSSGSLTIVELKRGKGHREAIAQLLDYASDLQQMDENEIFNSGKTQFNSLEEVFRSFYGNGEEYSYEEFRQNFLKSIKDPMKIQLVLASYIIGDDTKRLVEWLRNFGINILCVEFEYYKSEDKEIFVPKLLDIGDIKKASSKKTLTETQKKYLRFFSEILSRFKEIEEGATERRATCDNWLQIPTGFGPIHFEWLFRGREPNKMLEVGLHFEDVNEMLNQKLLEYFKSKEEGLRKEIMDIKFGKLGSKWRKIYVEKLVGSLDNALNDENIKEWAVMMMVKFYEVFKKRGEIDKAIQIVKSSI